MGICLSILKILPLLTNILIESTKKEKYFCEDDIQEIHMAFAYENRI